MKNITQKQFRKFFQDNMESIVGQARDSNSCPIATYYKKVENKEVSVASWKMWETPFAYIFDADINLKHWQIKFIEAVDEQYEFSGVYGKEALKILNKVTKKK